MGVHFLIHAVPIHIRSEVEPLLIKLLDGRGNLYRKADDLIGNELFLQRSAGIRPMIHNTDYIAPVEAVGRTMIAGVGIMEHCDGHPSKGFGSDYRGHIGKKFVFDRLQRPFGELTVIFPMTSDGIWKIVR